jgi:prenyltransferase beta subunit
MTAMYAMGRLDEMDVGGLVSWVLGCQHPNGGFGGSERHDPHILYTLSAVQVLQTAPLRNVSFVLPRPKAAYYVSHVI